MASCVRILARKSIFCRRQCQTPFSYALHRRNENESENAHRENTVSPSRYHHSGRTLGNNFFHLSPAQLCRFMSTEIGRVNDAYEASGDGDLAILVGDNAAVEEVAIAAADSFYPVAALQHLMDAVHIHTGFSWWASIAVTTLVIRSATLPLLIKQLIVTSKFTLLRPRLDEIRKEMEEKEMDPKALTEGREKMMGVFKEYGVSPLSPFMGAFIQAPIFISFFCAIQNMVEKVPSLKCGGALWFVDLTTPDSSYILPILTASSILITVECNMQEGLEGNPIAGKLKKVFRVLAIATIPLTIGFPKALFCYWITSNLFSLTYGLVLKIRGVKKALGVPEIPASEPSTNSHSSGS